jgi:hypothetical protein
MNWQVGQKVICDRPDQHSREYFVISAETGYVKVFCAEASVLVIGQQSYLEKLGWSRASAEVAAAAIS